MTLAGFVTILLLHSSLAPGAERVVRKALASAASGGRVELIDTGLALRQGCALIAATADRPERSGIVGLSLSGRDAAQRPCSGKGWARVRVYAPVWTTARAVKSGEPLDGVVLEVEREVTADAPLEAVPAGARAAMSLARGTVLEARHLRPEGPEPGTRVTVVVVVCELRIEQVGVALACPGRACVRLENGRRLEGTLVDGKVVVRP